MAYGGAPATVTRDAVRLHVGDISTSTASEFLTNTDFDYFVSASPNVWVACQMAANALAALFQGAAASASGSGYVTKKVGDLTLTKSDAASAAAEYRALAHQFSRRAAAGITPYAGGISASDKTSVESDTDRVVPAFTRRLFDNKSAMDFRTRSTST